MHQQLGTRLLLTFSFGLGPLSSELSQLAMEVDFHPLFLSFQALIRNYWTQPSQSAP